MNNLDHSSNKVGLKKIQVFISTAVVFSYVIKSLSKLAGGILLNVPPLVADGIHSFVDILEHGALVLGGRHARKSDTEVYPIGREPLIDLLQLTIFIGLIFMGGRFFVEGLRIIIATSLNIEWIKVGLSERAMNYFQMPYFPNYNVLLYAALILLFCFVISEIVYKYQKRLATNFGLREMIADAMELRSDGWIELTMSISFLSAWLITLMIGTDDNSGVVTIFSSLITGFILLGLSTYIIKIAIPEAYAAYQNLMNVSLKPQKRVDLENAINKRIPEKCDLISPLKAFHRGEQLFVLGQILIDSSLSVSTDMIIAQAERSARRFLSDTSEEVHIQLSPLFVPLNYKSIKSDIDKVLSDIWDVSPDCKLAQSFFSLRKGRLKESLSVALNEIENLNVNVHELSLALYLKGECLLRLKGANHTETEQAANELEKNLNTNISSTLKIIIASWLLIYITDKIRKTHDKQPEVILKRRLLNDLIIQNPDVSFIAKAEALFSIGYSWERCLHYDLEKSASLYKESEIFYSMSRSRSEMDKLMNTWGHMETLTYALGDAENHLELALEIKKIRGDELGLTFTYGCLGDLYSRMGKFNLADKNYKKDLELLGKLNITHQIPSVICKQGESIIRDGLINNNIEKAMMGITRCEESENIGLRDNIDPFFSQKGQLKGCLGIAALSIDPAEKNKNIQRSKNLLNGLDPKGSYQNAFKYRLSGRYHGLKGDTKKAFENLKNASAEFEKMIEPGYGVAFSLQSIACKIEILRSIISSNSEPVNDLNAINELNNFIEPFGGMLGDASILINDLIIKIKEAINKSGTKETSLPYIDRLIWFIEG